MNIKSIPTLSRTEYVINAMNQMGLVSKETVKQSLTSGDVLTLGSDDDPGYATYTNYGQYSFHVTGTDISAGKEMSDEEKWEAIYAKYDGQPMTLENYCQMVNDMEASGLITYEERTAATFHASSMTHNKVIEYDMRDGELWNEEIPVSFYLMDFEELLSAVSDESKDYNGYDANNDQRTFLKSLYEKMADHFHQE